MGRGATGGAGAARATARGRGRGGEAPPLPAGRVYTFRADGSGQYAYAATITSPDDETAGDGVYTAVGRRQPVTPAPRHVAVRVAVLDKAHTVVVADVPLPSP